MGNLLEVNTVEVVRMSKLSYIIGKSRTVLRCRYGGRPINGASPAADRQNGFDVLDKD